MRSNAHSYRNWGEGLGNDPSYPAEPDWHLDSVLGGVELASHRYLVAVTRTQIAPAKDAVKGAVTYRCINIAVDPESPSVAVKRLPG